MWLNFRSKPPLYRRKWSDFSDQHATKGRIWSGRSGEPVAYSILCTDLCTMTNRFLLLQSLFLVILRLSGFAQPLTVSQSTHLFNTTTELQTDSFLLLVTNPESYAVTITGYKVYNTYSTTPFTVSNAGMVIPAGATQSVWIYFHPGHNIFHNSEVVLLNDGLHGPVSIDVKGQGHYSNAYYDSSENLCEEALKTQLKTTTGQGYRSLGYSGGVPCARDTMFMIIDNQAANGQGASQNTIECVYTGRQIVGYIDRAQCQNTADPYYNFNTEHTFPQNFFNQSEPMRSDMFHLFPTDETANGKRASYPFGVVTNPSWSNGGSSFSQSAGIFEPRDVHKGEVARAMFYFVTRYQNYSNFLDSQEAILRQWHTQFPVTALEQNRCNLIASFQHNRNPFIDYPQFVDRITSFSTTSTAPVNYSLDLIDASIDMGGVTQANNVYNYVVVNNGNQPVTFSNFSLQPNVFSFQSGFNTTPTTIQPGDAITIPVVVNTPIGGLFTGSLDYTTDDPSHASVTVPINANILTIGVQEVSDEHALHVFPNPSTGLFCITPATTLIRVTDLQGRNVRNLPSNTDGCYDLQNKLSAGVYLLTSPDVPNLRQKLIITQ